MSIDIDTQAGPSTVPVPWPSAWRAWSVIGVLIAAYAFAIVDRIAIALLVQPIRADLGISDAQMGLLQGFAFGIFYSVFAIPIGWLADRHSRRAVLATGIVLWSAATMLCGLAQGFGQFFLARVGVGIGEASVTPAGSSLIADYFPPGERGRAYGAFMLGSTLGVGLAYFIGAFAIAASGRLRDIAPAWLGGVADWQIVFFLIGMPGLLLAVLVFGTIGEPLRRDRLLAAMTAGARPLLDLIRRNTSTYLIIIGGAALNLIVIYAHLAWFPTLFIRNHGWTAARVSVAFGSAVLPIGIVSAVTAGWLLNGLARRGRSDAPLLVMLAHAAFFIVFGTAVCLAPTAPLAYAAFVVVTIPAAWTYAAALTALNQITPNELRGQMTGAYTLVTGLVSMGIGAYAVGLLSDEVFVGPQGVGSSLAAVTLACSALSALLLIAGRRAFRRAADRATGWSSAVA
jgi:MFS family permease